MGPKHTLSMDSNNRWSKVDGKSLFCLIGDFVCFHFNFSLFWVFY